MRSNRVALRVLTNPSLFRSIVAYSSGVSFFTFKILRTLKCFKKPRVLWPADVAFVRNAVTSGDKCTLQALLDLRRDSRLGSMLPTVFKDIMGFALTHSKDTELLSWIFDKFTDNRNSGVTWEQSERLGELGDIAVARWAKEHEYRVSACGAAKFGHLSLVKLLHDAGDQDFTPSAMDVAATSGRLDIVQFLHENRTEGCTHAAMEGAAKNGHLEVLQFLHENRSEGCIPTALQLALVSGHVKCVKFLFEISSDTAASVEFATTAAIHGHLECIKYFHANDALVRFSLTTMHYAAINGHLAIVKFLHENRAEGCKVDTLFECDKRGLHKIVEFLCLQRPMANADRVVARAKQEGRFLFAARLERSARMAKVAYVYK